MSLTKLNSVRAADTHAVVGLPFTALVIDHFWDWNALRAAYAAWPAEDSKKWKRYRDGKQGLMRDIPEPLQKIIDRGMEPDFASLIRSKIAPDADDLFCDRTLFGAGLHHTRKGGKLGMHVDFNAAEVDGETIYRRANVLLYLNPVWFPEWGGQLCLGENQEVRIDPESNVMVAMPCTEDSWHGHPEPVCGPMPRRSIAWYWYSRTPPEGFTSKHSTIYA